jgi:predicted  nucleic acid-binding Zn-ribbon protein
MEILVIGVEPPCIRCHTAFKRAKEVAQQFPPTIGVRKVAIHSEEAEKYGKVESGHEIEEAGKVKPDIESMKRLLAELDELKADEEKNESLIDAKLKELQKAVQPVEDKARKLGYLMTPVLVVNEKVKSMGYVPTKDEIRGWVEIELRR